MKNDEGVESKNQKSLASFVDYCLEHPEERFWQALRNWSGNDYILKSNNVECLKCKHIKDTFYD